MGQALGWRRMAPQYPYVDGQAFLDGVSRNNSNGVWYSFNLCMHVPTYRGYWNYAWYVDMQVGNNVSNGRLVKARHYGSRLNIQGIDYYQSSYNGNFEGWVGVGGKDTTITLRATFHDSAGNWGNNEYWTVGIPTASAPSRVSLSTSNIATDSATLRGDITHRGNYTTITRWRLEWGKTNRFTNQLNYDNHDDMNHSWTISGLESDTTYLYRITVWNSAGYASYTDGTFKTLRDDIAYKVVSGEDPKLMYGWVIKPDGTRYKITKIRTVAPL